MNIDSHYYGTYYISMVAGFSHEEALQIAWAAQTVDECKIANIKHIRDEIPDDKFILTVTDPLENIRDGVSFLNDLDEVECAESDRITAVRAIWMPFHFLPGNFSPAIYRGNIKKFNGKKFSQYIFTDKWNEQDEHDMAMMCRTSSETCNLIIRNAKWQYDTRKDTNPTAALFAIGISMHVLADTWSHQYFVGSSNYYVNKLVSSTTDIPLIEKDIDRLNKSADLSVGIHTVDCLGHGLAGRAPDYAYMKDYRTVPYWNTEEREGQREIVRNNVKGFTNAFRQMLYALRYIRGEYQEIKLNKFIHLSDEDEKAVQEIKEKVFVFPANDQSRFWLYLINQKQVVAGIKNEVPDYKFYLSRADIPKIITFMEMAKLHRATVTYYINLHYPGVFSYYINTFHVCNGKSDYLFYSVLQGRENALILPKDIDKAIQEYYDDFKLTNKSVYEL